FGLALAAILVGLASLATNGQLHRVPGAASLLEIGPRLVPALWLMACGPLLWTTRHFAGLDKHSPFLAVLLRWLGVILAIAGVATLMLPKSALLAMQVVALVALAITALVAIYVDPAQPRYATAAYALLVGYLAYSSIVLLLFRSRTRFEPALRRLVHAADIFWPTVITLFTEGPSSPYYLFFIFVLLAAAYRWGFPETVGTAVLAVVLMLGQAAAFDRLQIAGALDLNRFVVRAGYLLILGFLLGYLAETEKRLRAQLALVPRILNKARAEIGLRGTLQGILDDLLRVFAARQAVFAVEETGSGRVFVWHTGSARDDQVRYAEMEPEHRGAYMFRTQAHTFHVLLGSRPGPADTVAVDVDGSRIEDAILLPPSFLRLHPCRSLIAAWFAFGDEWAGRVFLVDPAGGSDRESTLHF
ncbi:MAG: hypothetical protein ACRD3R_09845, partial [Terriglobales bacterium]